MIDGRQCRAARGWLGMPVQELAEIAGVNCDPLRRFEGGERHILRQVALGKVRATLEERGVAFTFTRDGRPLGIEDASLSPAEGSRYERLLSPEEAVHAEAAYQRLVAERRPPVFPARHAPDRSGER